MAGVMTALYLVQRRTNMACCGTRRKSRSDQKAKRKGGKAHKLPYSARMKIREKELAVNKARQVALGTWKPKLANT